MKINWKRVVIAAIWSELVLFVLFLLTVYYVSQPTRRMVNRLEWFGLLFLAGLWVARKINTYFILHGLLVGIIANILFFPLIPLIGLLLPASPRSGSGSGLLVSFLLKMFAAAAGAYVGGRLKNNSPA